MAKTSSKTEKQMSDILRHLHMQRESILNKWRSTCAEELIMLSKTSFSREEFNDQVPAILNILDQRLAKLPQESEVVIVAQEHGLHRWQRGYSLPELLVELEMLFNILMETINQFHKEQDISADVLLEVYEHVLCVSQEASRGSVLYYDELRQTNAAEQVNATRKALHQLEELGEKRNKHLRETTHDLRTGFSTLFGVSHLLELPGTEKERTELFAMLNRNLGSIRDMLLQLSDFSRIEAGQETLDIKEFDVADLLRKCVAAAHPFADYHNLDLRGEGPEKLKVKSDPVKIQRILQNLLMNALKYTTEGGIYISWAQENDTRWILSIQDTGPGFPASSPSGLLAEQLKPLSQQGSSHRQGGKSEYPMDQPPSTESIKNELSSQMKESEGLGLFIVKKLCELLRASMDIESSQGQGTLVRIRFVSHQ
ncbi:HAMP domain-containing histidine kinase [Dyadobacter sp. CY107]|uniref:sensor histidine kinase n=1 Tax=Dyadobacter fanqingshengii TaxID=2906443 RepID=UPI001F43BAD4|nr:HAMP domain-containing sensor histidine kinase [Dyadobacter fanqingshengii]MCF2502040.1 HAMP domain-containing histidine kinase [Dyadobacter fanqingshengii]